MDEKYFTCTVNDMKCRAVAKPVADALKQFCRQEPEFEQAIEQSRKTFDECLGSIMHKVGGSISDVEVYRRAVKFYFPTADIHFEMHIDTCGNDEHSGGNDEHSGGAAQNHQMNLSLDSLLDF